MICQLWLEFTCYAKFFVTNLICVLLVLRVKNRALILFSEHKDLRLFSIFLFVACILEHLLQKLGAKCFKRYCNINDFPAHANALCDGYVVDKDP